MLFFLFQLLWGGSNDYFRDVCSVTRSNSIIGSINSSVPQVSGAETSNYSVCMSKNNVSGATEVSFSTPTAVGSRQIGSFQSNSACTQYIFLFRLWSVTLLLLLLPYTCMS